MTIETNNLGPKQGLLRLKGKLGLSQLLLYVTDYVEVDALFVMFVSKLLVYINF